MNTKFEMLNAFLNGSPFVAKRPSGSLKFKVINSIQREDGSNHSYILGGLSLSGVRVANYLVRTID